MRLLLESILCMLILFFACSCKKQQVSLLSGQGGDTDESVIDLVEIEEGGELICVTLNGPDTYYEYHGRNTGLQYVMAEHFANSLGLRLRMETASDTAEVINMLKTAKADVIVLELPMEMIVQNGLEACGADDRLKSWAVNKDAVQLKNALNDWYDTNVRVLAKEEMNNSNKRKFKKHTDYSAFYSKAKGVVSNYDALFLRASRICGWSWQLLASQCYQESGFDPNAVSWVGARGLMQIMPSTAKGMGVSPDALFDPETNMITAAYIIKGLEGNFSDIKNVTERKKFVLAAYNGGYGHVIDAMRLAEKYGKNSHSWDDVGYYVLHLSDSKFYKDPIVKYGYMVGSETYNYVNSVMGRWNGYHAVLRNSLPKGMTLADADKENRKNNRFSKKQNIKAKDDSLFSINR